MAQRRIGNLDQLPSDKRERAELALELVLEFFHEPVNMEEVPPEGMMGNAAKNASTLGHYVYGIVRMLQSIESRLTKLEVSVQQAIDRVENPSFDWTRPHYSVREAAEFLNVSPEFIRIRIRRGKLEAKLHQGTNKYQIDRDSLRAYYEERLEYQQNLTLTEG